MTTMLLMQKDTAVLEFGAARDEWADEFCRFTTECLKLARTAKDETNRAVFLQMAQVWVPLARKEETSSDRNVRAEN